MNKTEGGDVTGRPQAPDSGSTAADPALTEGFYWQRHPDSPFATLIAVATTYLSPDGYDLGTLQRLARREDLAEMQVFNAELREALKDPSQLPRDELSESVEYDDTSDERFLQRLWLQLYGDEPLP